MKLQQLPARPLRGSTQSQRIPFYRHISSNHMQRNQVRLQRPLLCTGRSRIVLGHCHIGVQPSPRLWDSYCHLEAREASASIQIDDGVWLNNAAILIAERSSIHIASGCLIGPSVQIFDSDFHHLDPALRTSGRHACAPVRLEENVFVGASVTILKGVTIGCNSVVAAGALVIASVPPNCVVAGHPAKVVRRLD